MSTFCEEITVSVSVLSVGNEKKIITNQFIQLNKLVSINQ